MSDLNFQDFSTVQSDKQQKPVTLASAATIAPSTMMTFITGTVAIATITPPVTGSHILVLVFTNAAPAALATTGNIQRAAQPVQNVPLLAVYDPLTGKYWIGSVSAVI